MAKRKFFLTTLTVEVLSEDSPLDPDMSLTDVDEFIGEGDGVGRIRFSKRSITSRGAATTAKLYGSEPGFFRLDDKGRTVEDD